MTKASFNSKGPNFCYRQIAHTYGGALKDLGAKNATCRETVVQYAIMDSNMFSINSKAFKYLRANKP